MKPITYLEKRVSYLNYRKQYALERIKIKNGKSKTTVSFLNKLFYKLDEEIGDRDNWNEYVYKLNNEIKQFKKAIKLLKKNEDTNL